MLRHRLFTGSFEFCLLLFLSVLCGSCCKVVRLAAIHDALHLLIGTEVENLVPRYALVVEFVRREFLALEEVHGTG